MLSNRGRPIRRPDRLSPRSLTRPLDGEMERPHVLVPIPTLMLALSLSSFRTSYQHPIRLVVWLRADSILSLPEGRGAFAGTVSAAMSANYWESTQRRYWLFTKDQLATMRQKLEDDNAELVRMFPLPQPRHLAIYFNQRECCFPHRLGRGGG